MRRDSYISVIILSLANLHACDRASSAEQHGQDVIILLQLSYH